MSLAESIRQRAASASERLRVRSALNPILWLCAIVAVPAIYAAIELGDKMPNWLIVLLYMPIVTACFGFLFLLFVDRDKLQSEDYQIRKQTLDLIYEKGSRIPINPATLDHITNPEKPKLGSGPEETK